MNLMALEFCFTLMDQSTKESFDSASKRVMEESSIQTGMFIMGSG